MSEWKYTEFGQIPVEWDLKTVEEIKSSEKYSMSMGPFGSNITVDNFISEGVPVIRGANLNFDRFVDGEFVFVSNEKADQLKSSNCRSGDLVFTHRGTIGQVGIIPFKTKYERYIISQSGMKLTVDSKKVDPFFAFYFFKSRYGQFQLLKNESQVGVPSISTPLTSLKEIEIPVPPLIEQTSIVSIPSSLDDKIDLLHRQNKTLEALAETLFRQWFVEEAEEKLKNGQVYSIGNLIDTVSQTYNFKESEQVVFLNTSDIFAGKVINHTFSDVTGLPGQAKKSIHKNDILYSEIRPANKRYAFIDFDVTNYVVSTKLMVLRANGLISPSIIYFYLTHPQTLSWLQMLAEARSGTFPQITFDQVKEMKINVPTGDLLVNITAWTESTLNKICKNNKQILTLTRLRDTLLPKLMSGEVRVNISNKWRYNK